MVVISVESKTLSKLTVTDASVQPGFKFRISSVTIIGIGSVINLQPNSSPTQFLILSLSISHYLSFSTLFSISYCTDICAVTLENKEYY